MTIKYLAGLACGLAAGAALAQNPPATQPPPTTQPGLLPANLPPPYPTPLYRMADVGKTLNLTPEQVTNLNKLTDATQARYRDDYAKLGALTDAERFARTQELNQQYLTDWNKGAQSVFDDAQRTRYQQLDYQYGGFNTLYDPAVQKQLNLTAEQQRNLRAQWDWSNQQLADINRVGATDPTKGTQMFTDYWTARQERMNQFLTAEQQKAWGRMVGDPYTFRPTFPPGK